MKITKLIKKGIVAFAMISMLGLYGCGNETYTNINDINSDLTNANNEEMETTSNTTGEQGDAQNVGNSNQVAEGQSEFLTGLHHVEIIVKDYGTIEVELDADTAPISTTNFINLANDGFYDGLTFHRIMSGFMIQGGDPLGNGFGGADNTITGEFAANGIQNDISHTRGTISMARSQDPNSASSQFFIMHADADYLDGNYAAFGHVTSGMEIVDAICANTPVQDSNGTVLAADQPVIEKITVID